MVTGAPVQNVQESYPGSPLQQGDIGSSVSFIQVALNRISQNYPAISKIPVDAVFGTATDATVRAFQPIFSLDIDGIVGRATWYAIVMLYTAVLKLSELQSQGQTFYGYYWEYLESISYGEQGAKVTHLQYMLSVISQFNSAVQEPSISGYFGDGTQAAVRSFQRAYDLPETGSVDRAVRDSIYAQFAGIEETVFGNEALFPFTRPPIAVDDAELQSQLAVTAAAFPDMQPPQKTGRVDAATRRSIAAFQRASGTAPTGLPDSKTRQRLAGMQQLLQHAGSTRFVQFPGRTLQVGMQDSEVRRV